MLAIDELLSMVTAARRPEIDAAIESGREYVPETDQFRDTLTVDDYLRIYSSHYKLILDGAATELGHRAGKLELKSKESLDWFQRQFASGAEALRHRLKEEYESRLFAFGITDERRFDEVTCAVRTAAIQDLTHKAQAGISAAYVSAQRDIEGPSILRELAEPPIVADVEDRQRAVAARVRAKRQEMTARGQLGFGPAHLAIAEMYEEELAPRAAIIGAAYKAALNASNKTLTDDEMRRVLNEAEARIVEEFETLNAEMLEGTRQHLVHWFPRRFRERMDVPRAKAINDVRLAVMEHRNRMPSQPSPIAGRAIPVSRKSTSQAIRQAILRAGGMFETLTPGPHVIEPPPDKPTATITPYSYSTITPEAPQADLPKRDWFLVHYKMILAIVAILIGAAFTARAVSRQTAENRKFEARTKITASVVPVLQRLSLAVFPYGEFSPSVIPDPDSVRAAVRSIDSAYVATRAALDARFSVRVVAAFDSLNRQTPQISASIRQLRLDASMHYAASSEGAGHAREHLDEYVKRCFAAAVLANEIQGHLETESNR